MGREAHFLRVGGVRGAISQAPLGDSGGSGILTLRAWAGRVHGTNAGAREADPRSLGRPDLKARVPPTEPRSARATDPATCPDRAPAGRIAGAGRLLEGLLGPLPP